MNARLVWVIVSLWSLGAVAQGTYLEADTFVSQTFGGDPPTPKTLWVNEEVQSLIRPILGHDLPKLRLVYWAKDERSLWVLEEIGKERPITTGLVVNEGKLENVEVL